MTSTRAGVLLCALLLSACVHVAAPELPQTLPERWQQQPLADAALPAADLRGWWRAFKDPLLDQLVSSLLEQNLDLAQAQSRLKQARGLAEASASEYLPSLSAGARSVDSASGRKSYFHATLDAIWDLGAFGMRDGLALQAQGQAQAAQAEVQALRVSQIAELLRHYIALRAAQAQTQNLAAQQALDEQQVALIDARIQAHQMAASEQENLARRQQQTRLALAASKLEALRAAQAIAALLGRTEADPTWQSPAPQPLAPALRIRQVPSDLLRTRPDIWRAEADVLAAAGDAAQARARLYPRIALGASYLFAYDLDTHRKSHVDGLPLIGPLIDIPLFDWGGRQAASAASQAALQSALLGYRQTLVNAVAQTEVALAELDFQRLQLAQQEAEQNTLQQQAQRQAALLMLGLASRYDALRASSAQQQTSQALIAARASHALALVSLFKSLGGAPQPESEAP